MNRGVQLLLMAHEPNTGRLSAMPPRIPEPQLLLTEKQERRVGQYRRSGDLSIA